MDLHDILGKTIKVGSFIRYNGTGTVGKVIDTKEENGTSFVQIDETNLWYACDSLEVLSQNEVKIKDNFFKDEDDGDFDIEKAKKAKEEMDSPVLETTGSVGGG